MSDKSIYDLSREIGKKELAYKNVSCAQLTAAVKSPNTSIQEEEGRRELYESKKAISAANLFTQLEIAALVVMAIGVQIIILYTPK